MHRTLLFCIGLWALWSLVLAEFNCRTDTNGIMLVHDAIAAQAQYGAASSLKPGWKEPWPLVDYSGKKLRVVLYCYTNAGARNELDPKVRAALNIWDHKLGPAHPYTGHNLAWAEATDGNTGQYCYDDSHQWNTKIDTGTLHIWVDPDLPESASARAGYEPNSNQPGRHSMGIGSRAHVNAVVHEFLHVFGKLHEMHRSDRDDNVWYQCNNVEGYYAALAAAMAAGFTKDVAHIRLCEEYEFAHRYNFDGSQFMIYTPLGIVDDSPDFDLNSIMLYPSDGLANPACQNNPFRCPLLKWVEDANGQKTELAWIHHNTDPSVGDIEWVKKWYPWVGYA